MGQFLTHRFPLSGTNGLKKTAPKFYLFIFNLENFVETLDYSLKPGTLVEITFLHIFLKKYVERQEG